MLLVCVCVSKQKWCACSLRLDMTSPLTVFLFSPQCPSSRRSTTWALRWWSQVTPWYRPGLIWPSWFTLWTTAAQTRSDCYTSPDILSPTLTPLLPLPSSPTTSTHLLPQEINSSSDTDPSSPSEILHRWLGGVTFLWTCDLRGAVGFPCDADSPASPLSLPQG